MKLTDHEQKLLLRALDKASASAEAETAAKAFIASLRQRGISGYDFVPPTQTGAKTWADTQAKAWADAPHAHAKATDAEEYARKAAEFWQQWDQAKAQAKQEAWRNIKAQQEADQAEAKFRSEAASQALSWPQTFNVIILGFGILLGLFALQVPLLAALSAILIVPSIIYLKQSMKN